MAGAPPLVRRDSERGVSLVSLIAGVTIMFIMMSVAVPGWRYVMKDAREEELLFRGEQIARAVERYQRKNGNALPPSLEILVQQRHLRKAYKDPFAKDGKWRLVRPGEAILPPGVPGLPTTPTPTTLVGSAPGGGTIGGSITVGGAGILGVASLNKDKSLRMFNGRTRYDEWLFIAGQPRLVGRQFGPAVLPRGVPAKRPSSGPSGPRQPSNNR